MVSQEQVKDAVRKVAIKHGALKAVLFGSYARNSATRRSDIDVIFVENTSACFLDRLDKYMNSLWEQLRVSAEVLVYTPDELEKISWKPFIKRVFKEGIIVYEQ